MPVSSGFKRLHWVFIGLGIVWWLYAGGTMYSMLPGVDSIAEFVIWTVLVPGPLLLYLVVAWVVSRFLKA